jgi:hypothetical protein
MCPPRPARTRHRCCRVRLRASESHPRYEPRGDVVLAVIVFNLVGMMTDHGF